MLEYRENVKGCANGSGFATVVSAPLFNVPLEQRDLTLVKSQSDWGASAPRGGRRILLVTTRPESGKQLTDEDPNNITPRSELIVELYKPPAPSKPNQQQPPVSVVRNEMSDIHTAHIKFRHFRIGSRDLAPLSSEKVDEILATADLEKHPENFADSAAKLCLPNKVSGRPLIPAAKEWFYAGQSSARQVRLMPAFTTDYGTYIPTPPTIRSTFGVAVNP